jgi:hypothetical protein
MTGFKFDDIVSAVHFASAEPQGGNFAYLDVKTGRVFYQSLMMDIDELRGRKIDRGQLMGVPHKNDLGLGRSLAFEFVDVNLPDEHHVVRDMFRQKGAYRRFKGFLESKGVLEAWYRFENEREEKSLRAWCEENRIPLSD